MPIDSFSDWPIDPELTSQDVPTQDISTQLQHTPSPFPEALPAISTPQPSGRRVQPQRTKARPIYKINGHLIDHITQKRVHNDIVWYTVHWKNDIPTPQTADNLIKNGCRGLIEEYEQEFPVY